MSPNLQSAEYLLIIIHGMGVVRAGQWSRKYSHKDFLFVLTIFLVTLRLIINENLHIGSQLDYIQRALGQDYSVLVTNTNQNIDESSSSIPGSRPLPIRVSIFFN